MTTHHSYASASDDLLELVEIFARQLAAVRHRLRTLHDRRNAIARIERPLLLEQENAWQRGIELLQRSRILGAGHITEVLSRWAESGAPGREVYAAMAAMVAIRTAWASATSAQEKTFRCGQFGN